MVTEAEWRFVVSILPLVWFYMEALATLYTFGTVFKAILRAERPTFYWQSLKRQGVKDPKLSPLQNLTEDLIVTNFLILVSLLVGFIVGIPESSSIYDSQSLFLALVVLVLQAIVFLKFGSRFMVANFVTTITVFLVPSALKINVDLFGIILTPFYFAVLYFMIVLVSSILVKIASLILESRAGPVLGAIPQP